MCVETVEKLKSVFDAERPNPVRKKKVSATETQLEEERDALKKQITRQNDALKSVLGKALELRNFLRASSLTLEDDSSEAEVLFT